MMPKFRRILNSEQPFFRSNRRGAMSTMIVVSPVNPLIERLRRRPDWRLTAQRRVVAEAFDGEHVHLTADEVLTRARRRMPEISLATVYNTLNELIALGEVQPVRTGRGRPRYDPNTAQHHDHLVCLACGAIHDVYPRRRATLPSSQRFGHQIVGQETLFQGYCPRCQQRTSAILAPDERRRGRAERDRGPRADPPPRRPLRRRGAPGDLRG